MQRKKEGKKGDKIRPRMDPFPQINHTLVTNTILFLKNCLFFHAVCACGSPWWHERRASAGHKPTQARDEIRNGGGCAPSGPRLHTRSMQVHEETRLTHGGRVLLQRQGAVLCGCADLREGGPWTSTRWMETVPLPQLRPLPGVQMWRWEWVQLRCWSGPSAFFRKIKQKPRCSFPVQWWDCL